MPSTLQKLEILADAAKYDASCASSGFGSTSNGICHSYTPDGRCVSLRRVRSFIITPDIVRPPTPRRPACAQRSCRGRSNCHCSGEPWSGSI